MPGFEKIELKKEDERFKLNQHLKELFDNLEDYIEKYSERLPDDLVEILLSILKNKFDINLLDKETKLSAIQSLIGQLETELQKKQTAKEVEDYFVERINLLEKMKNFVVTDDYAGFGEKDIVLVDKIKKFLDTQYSYWLEKSKVKGLIYSLLKQIIAYEQDSILDKLTK